MQVRHFWVCLISMLCTITCSSVLAQNNQPDSRPAFIHPGGLHTQADLDRMRTHVKTGDHPWIDSWNELLQNPKAQLTYKPAPRNNMGASRQRASADAVAAYLNAIRGYVSGDTAYTDHAIQICNLWSSAVNQLPTGTDQPGLNGIYTYQFALVGEILRIHVGTRWTQNDFDRFKHMMRTYLYPTCHDFLVRHNGTDPSHYWANWDASCIAAIGCIGILCDDRALFNEAIDYFKNGNGNGNIHQAVYFIHPGNLGQWQESGRDEEHAAGGLGMLAAFCQAAQNQGVDLYSYDNNRLLAGAEYTAMFNLWKEVPYKFYNNADVVNQYWASRSQRGRLQRPIWEMLYNQYVVKMGLQAPNLTRIAALNRPEGYSHDDHFGYGTLTFTLQPSSFPPFPAPAVPEKLSAVSGISRVDLKWIPPETANGFTIKRATMRGGPYTELTRYRGIIPEYTDTSVVNGTTYYYVVSANNQAGSSSESQEVSATPMAASYHLPGGWKSQQIGDTAKTGEAQFASVGEGTFLVTGSGAGIGGKRDSCYFTFNQFNGDAVFSARLIDGDFKGSGGRARIGIMIRANSDPESPMAAMVLGDVGARMAHFVARTNQGIPATEIKGNEYSGLAQAPTWFRIERRGNAFTAFQSDNGEKWYNVGSVVIPMNPNAIFGIAIASNSAELIRMTFDHVTLDAK